MGDIVEAYFLGHPANAVLETDDWVKAFEELGLSKNTSSALMQPDFIDLRLTKSAAGWAKWIAEENLYTLECADQMVKVNLLAMTPAVRSGREQATISEESVATRPAQPKTITNYREPPAKAGHLQVFRASIMSRLLAATTACVLKQTPDSTQQL